MRPQVKKSIKWITLPLSLLAVVAMWFVFNARAVVNFFSVPYGVSVTCLEWHWPKSSSFTLDRVCADYQQTHLIAQHVTVQWQGLLPLTLQRIEVDDLWVQVDAMPVGEQTAGVPWLPALSVVKGRLQLPQLPEVMRFDLHVSPSVDEVLATAHLRYQEAELAELELIQSPRGRSARWTAQAGGLSHFLTLWRPEFPPARLDGVMVGSVSESNGQWVSEHHWRIAGALGERDASVGINMNVHFRVTRDSEGWHYASDQPNKIHLMGAESYLRQAHPEGFETSGISLQSLSADQATLQLPSQVSFKPSERRVEFDQSAALSWPKGEMVVTGFKARGDESGHMESTFTVQLDAQPAVVVQGIPYQPRLNTKGDVTLASDHGNWKIQHAELALPEWHDGLVSVSAPVAMVDGQLQWHRSEAPAFSGRLRLDAKQLSYNKALIGMVSSEQQMALAEGQLTLTGVAHLNRQLLVTHQLMVAGKTIKAELTLPKQSSNRLTNLLKVWDASLAFGEGEVSGSLKAVGHQGVVDFEFASTLHGVDVTRDRASLIDTNGTLKGTGKFNDKLNSSAKLALGVTDVRFDERSLGAVALQSDIVVSNGAWRLAGDTVWQSALTLRHQASGQAGQMQFQMDVPAQNARGLLPFIKPYLTEPAEIQQGTLRALVSGRRDQNQWQGYAQAVVDGLDFSYGTYAAQGASSTLDIALIDQQFVTKLGQGKLAQIDVGVPIADLQWQWLVSGTPTKPQIDVIDLQGNVLKGTFGVDAYTLYPQKDQKRFLRLDQLSLDELMRLHPQPGIELTGRLGGELPLLFSSGSVEVVQGTLNSQQEGRILVRDNPAFSTLKQQQPDLRPVLELLENLNYDHIHSDVNMNKNGDLDMVVAIKGVNPDQEQPVNFNYRHQENLYMLLKTLRLGDNLSRTIEKKMSQ